MNRILFAPVPTTDVHASSDAIDPINDTVYQVDRKLEFGTRITAGC
jgi:hypothetical protein